MRQFILSLVLWACCLVPVAMAETPFAPGQVWTLSDKDFPETRITVDKVETWNGKPIVHISITDVRVPSAPDQPPGFTTVQHMPFTQDALRASVGTLVQAEGQPFAGFEGGYQQWQNAHGGVFTISVGQALKIALGMVPPGTGSTAPDSKPAGAAN